jgi:Raf kinase inhibitor-like YbhB/YbcL family protein
MADRVFTRISILWRSIGTEFSSEARLGPRMSGNTLSVIFGAETILKSASTHFTKEKVMKKISSFFCFILCLFLFASVVPGKETARTGMLMISSPAFENNGLIPEEYTCEGRNVNPRLVIGNIPPGTKSFALIVDDPDAPMGTWVHWVVWNIPPETREIRENSLPAGANQGLNDFRKHEYGGPCPPSGTHRYFFKLYALDALLDLPHNTTKTGLEKAMTGHVIEHSGVVGLYKRR